MRDAENPLASLSQMAGQAVQGGEIIFDYEDAEILHESGKSAFVAKSVGKAEMLEIGRDRAGDAADQVDAAEGQMDEREVPRDGS